MAKAKKAKKVEQQIFEPAYSSTQRVKVDFDPFAKSQDKNLKVKQKQKPALTKSAASKIKNNVKKKFDHPAGMNKKDFVAACNCFIEMKKIILEHTSSTISYYISERENGLKALKQLNKAIKIEKNEEILNSYLRLIDYYGKSVKISNAHIQNYRDYHGLELKSLTATQKKLKEVK